MQPVGGEGMKEDEIELSLDQLSLSNKTKCILCKAGLSTMLSYIMHLSRHHKTSLIKEGCTLLCSCGAFMKHSREVQDHLLESQCDGHTFTVERSDEAKDGRRREMEDGMDGGMQVDYSNGDASRIDNLLAVCEQRKVMGMEEFMEGVEWGEKVGEGGYAEVFLVQRQNEQERKVFKLLPLAEDEDAGKFFGEVVISKELTRLRSGRNSTSAFAKLYRASVIQGLFPRILSDAWEVFREEDDDAINEDNPQTLGDSQLYLCLECEYGGLNLKKFPFASIPEVVSVFCQTALALAVAESEFKFEHRDLHEENVLVKRTEEQSIEFTYDRPEQGDGPLHQSVPTHGVKTTIIDFTLSRMTSTPELRRIIPDVDINHEIGDDICNQDGSEEQYQVYKKMKKLTKGNWALYTPKSNVLWLLMQMNWIIQENLNAKSELNKARVAATESEPRTEGEEERVEMSGEQWKRKLKEGADLIKQLKKFSKSIDRFEATKGAAGDGKEEEEMRGTRREMVEVEVSEEELKKDREREEAEPSCWLEQEPSRSSWLVRWSRGERSVPASSSTPPRSSATPWRHCPSASQRTEESMLPSCSFVCMLRTRQERPTPESISLRQKMAQKVPRAGMSRFMKEGSQKLFVTNDAATILRELEIQHPAAKIVVMASQMQEKQVGDNTNTIVIPAAALLEDAPQLIYMGLTPQEVASGYEMACEKALELLSTLVVKEATELKDPVQVKRWIRSAITSKQYDNEKVIVELVSKACVQTCPKNAANFNVDNIRICKIVGSGVHSSTVMSGMVFKRGAEGEIKKAKKARIVVYTCPFDLTQTETKARFLSRTRTSSKDTLLARRRRSRNRLTSKFDLRRLCRTVGAQAQTIASAAGERDIMAFKKKEEDKKKNKEVTEHERLEALFKAACGREKTPKVGDNTNTVVILAAALLEHAAQLIYMGLTPQEVASGYEMACEKALELLSTLVVKEATELKDPVQVKRWIRSAITSKQYDNEEVIVELVSKACVQTCPKNAANFNVDNIRICKGSNVQWRHGANAEELQTDSKTINEESVFVEKCSMDMDLMHLDKLWASKYYTKVITPEDVKEIKADMKRVLDTATYEKRVMYLKAGEYEFMGEDDKWDNTAVPPDEMTHLMTGEQPLVRPLEDQAELERHKKALEVEEDSEADHGSYDVDADDERIVIAPEGSDDVGSAINDFNDDGGDMMSNGFMSDTDLDDPATSSTRGGAPTDFTAGDDQRVGEMGDVNGMLDPMFANEMAPSAAVRGAGKADDSHWKGGEIPDVAKKERKKKVVNVEEELKTRGYFECTEDMLDKMKTRNRFKQAQRNVELVKETDELLMPSAVRVLPQEDYDTSVYYHSFFLPQELHSKYVYRDRNDIVDPNDTSGHEVIHLDHGRLDHYTNMLDSSFREDNDEGEGGDVYFGFLRMFKNYPEVLTHREMEERVRTGEMQADEAAVVLSNQDDGDMMENGGDMDFNDDDFGGGMGSGGEEDEGKPVLPSADEATFVNKACSREASEARSTLATHGYGMRVENSEDGDDEGDAIATVGDREYHLRLIKLDTVAMKTALSDVLTNPLMEANKLDETLNHFHRNIPTQRTEAERKKKDKAPMQTINEDEELGETEERPALDESLEDEYSREIDIEATMMEVPDAMNVTRALFAPPKEKAKPNKTIMFGEGASTSQNHSHSSEHIELKGHHTLKSTFTCLPARMPVLASSDVTVASTIAMILHLANENNLILEQDGQNVDGIDEDGNTTTTMGDWMNDFEATELLTRLYAAHEAGEANAGVDIIEGGVANAVDLNIFDLYAGKRSAIKLATEAAATILKVDQLNTVLPPLSLASRSAATSAYFGGQMSGHPGSAAAASASPFHLYQNGWSSNGMSSKQQQPAAPSTMNGAAANGRNGGASSFYSNGWN